MDPVSPPAPALLCCDSLDVTIAGLPLVRGLSVQLAAGELVCIVGCNGAGKTTLMHTLAGLRPDGNTSIELDQRPLSTHSRAEIARRVALLLQQQQDYFPATVLEAVLLGRHPHLGFWDRETGDDRRIARAALASLGLGPLADREIHTLSGGERQRVAIAAVLAQQPALYLLDEPLNNLDPRHQIAVLHRLRNETQRGAAVVVILHDLNLVSRFADQVLLLYGPAKNGAWQYGSVGECMTTVNLSRLYQTPIERFELEGRAFFANP